ncbi:MAG: tRNA uridine-5-carboxymethylaminomethyl(34) synthesis GTPase MnmE [Lachnospiraceae bacterium]|nr:tRNA uridine-5-carboxymethylaminomethyl(34) synthesis GTPase MnmE [Lachnospiraceae bacterium]
MYYTDTIAAIATAAGNSGIGIIRISGSDSIIIADKIIKSKTGRSIGLCDKDSHTISYGFVFDENVCIDEVLVFLYRAPKSYTAEDSVEISCHGGMYVLKRVLDTVIKNGARPAEPGEFTKRAFENGRIDLTQSEAVMDMISSENEFSRKNSIEQLRGSVKDMIISLRGKILDECAYIEAALDDPEHYDLDGYTSVLDKKITDMIKDADELIDSSKNARYLKEGINAAIIGRPNAGKSSLLNMLLGYERAIVTKEEGTTRDLIEEKISLDGIVLNLTDTAGIRSSDNEAERIGIKKARDIAKTSDLILAVLDGSEKLNENDIEILSSVSRERSLILINKNDIDNRITAEDIKKYSEADIISISSKTGDGFNELKDKIKEMFYTDKISDNKQIYLTNLRQLNSFINARDSLLLVKNAIENKMTEDVFTVDLMDAYEELGRIIGESTDDALADKIFKDFCMGK